MLGLSRAAQAGSDVAGISHDAPDDTAGVEADTGTETRPAGRQHRARPSATPNRARAEAGVDGDAAEGKTDGAGSSVADASVAGADLGTMERMAQALIGTQATRDRAHGSWVRSCDPRWRATSIGDMPPGCAAGAGAEAAGEVPGVEEIDVDETVDSVAETVTTTVAPMSVPVPVPVPVEAGARGIAASAGAAGLSAPPVPKRKCIRVEIL